MNRRITISIILLIVVYTVQVTKLNGRGHDEGLLVIERNKLEADIQELTIQAATSQALDTVRNATHLTPTTKVDFGVR